jgi:hypothetical protein
MIPLPVLSPLVWKFVKIGVVVLTLLATVWWIHHRGYVDGKEEVQAEWNSERAARGQALAEAQARIRDLESSLTTTAATIRKETNAELVSIAAQRDALATRVRLAEARARLPSTPAGPPDAAAGPINPEPLVLATIGTADVDEAHRADTIRLELMACYAQYARVEAAFNGEVK